MKRSEMLQYIEEELLEFHKNYQQASDKAKKHKLKNASESILAMIEGFGMVPPLYIPNGALGYPDQALAEHEWEEEQA